MVVGGPVMLSQSLTGPDVEALENRVLEHLDYGIEYITSVSRKRVFEKLKIPLETYSRCSIYISLLTSPIR